MFSIVTRNKLRFATVKGAMTVEQVWDMPLSSADGFNLDELAIGLKTQIDKSADVKSFVSSASSKDKDLELRFNIVKHIIDVKMSERNDAAGAEIKKAKKQVILEALKSAQSIELNSKTPAQLQKMLDDLD